ncbi:MAG: hypothetical protein JJT78_08155 [Leptospira sp.]|nr:hypothetical protein [Leptospira sp.]
MSLNEKEITEILVKIRSEYKTYAKENPKAFDAHGFEKRYLQALQMKMNITRFLNDEVAFLEQLKKKHQEIIAKKEAAKGDTINRIMDEAIERLSKYQKIDFHPLAKPEIRYFYGAMRDFGEIELPIMIHVFRGTPEYRDFQDNFHVLERIAIPRGHQPSPRMLEHSKALLDANGNQMLMEKDTQDVLKNTCLALNKMANMCRDLISKDRISTNLMVKIDERDYPKAVDFNQFNHKEAVEKIILKCDEIIEDFRMKTIVNL